MEESHATAAGAKSLGRTKSPGRSKVSSSSCSHSSGVRWLRRFFIGQPLYPVDFCVWRRHGANWPAANMTAGTFLRDPQRDGLTPLPSP